MEQGSVLAEARAGASFDQEEIGQRWEEGRLPEDLRDWIKEGELRGLVSEAVERMAPGLEPAARSLLEVLTFSYAIGQYSSEEIDDTLAGEADVAEEWARREFCDPRHSVRHFRRSHRAGIENCLSQVLAHVWKIAPGDAALDFRGEAARRIKTAVRLDCWMADF